MALIDILSAASVVPISGEDLQVTFRLLQPGEFPVAADEHRPDPARRADPTVSCLMVTTGRRGAIRHALDCYGRQTYENRELVVVTEPDSLRTVVDLAAASGAPNVFVHAVGPEMTLGDRRSLSVARAKGEIVMHWDDDDLYDPLRIAAAVALLRQAPAAAVMLARLLVWWPARRLAAISENRLWENSIAVWREHAPAYPSLDKGEDTPAVAALARTRPIATCDFPLLYVYTVHAENTWGASHFEEILGRAVCAIQGGDYDELMQLLSARMPVLPYQAELTADSPWR